VSVKEVVPFLDAHDRSADLPEEVEPAIAARAFHSMQDEPAGIRLRPGDRLGPYEIVDAIGAGGMGEVYKARDTRLGRTVAIKLLRSEFSSDPDFEFRFEREARVISQLNHPHICTLHDVGHHNGMNFLVMEYVEGETIAQRLTRGALRVDQALRYASEIADALDRAHRQGFVHRDLKPGNIMLTRSGAKLLDFGIAKFRSGQHPGSGDPPMDTLTGPGAIVGTVQYMAPEQLQGKEVDSRTDIFAFGAVLYELLTGRKTFEGESQAAVIAAILEREPSARDLQPAVPKALEWTIRTCLAKDPDERWQSAADIRHELRAIASRPVEGGEEPAMPRRNWSRRERLVWVLVAVAAVAIAALALALRPRTVPVSSSAVSRFALAPPEGHAYDRIHAISPDGRRLAFVAVDAKQQRGLWTRALDAVTPQRHAGTEGASYPFWSPDGGFVGFFANNALKKVDLATGAVETICNCDTGAGGGGTWNKDGVILFSKGLVADTLWRVPASGGVAAAATQAKGPRPGMNVWPQFLPDGTHYLSLRVDASGGGLYVGSLDSDEAKRILEYEPHRTRGWYAAGYLFFLRERALMAQRFDTERLDLVGDAVRVAEEVEQTAPGRSFFGVAPGVLAYREPADTAPHVRLTWLDRNGHEIGSLGDAGPYAAVSLSRDGRFLLTTGRGMSTASDSGSLVGRSLVRIDTASGIPTPLGLRGGSPAWAPDGARFAFSGGRRGGPVPSIASVGGIEVSKRFARGFTGQSWPFDWSRDGRYIVGEALHAVTLLDLWAVDMRDDPPAVVRDLLRAPGNQRDPQVSPDGRWLAYASDEGSRGYEVYMRPFPEGSDIWRVSGPGGGRSPAWTRDGRELLYVSPEGTLMRVAVTKGREFSAEPPEPLFQHDALREGFSRDVQFGRFFDVAPDGRILVVVPVTDAPAQPIIVVLQWEQLLTGPGALK
jgi:serine/threonine protein kinase/Tol biopolymer transport system component